MSKDSKYPNTTKVKQLTLSRSAAGGQLEVTRRKILLVSAVVVVMRDAIDQQHQLVWWRRGAAGVTSLDTPGHLLSRPCGLGSDELEEEGRERERMRKGEKWRNKR